MPIQVYECPIHGEFEVTMSFSKKVPESVICKGPSQCGHDTKCGLRSEHVLKPITAAIVEGGTGGGKDMHLPR